MFKRVEMKLTILISLAVASLSPVPLFGQATITLDPAVRLQTMNGWEAVAWASQDSASFPGYKESLLRRAATEVGINRLRVEVRSGAENATDYWAQYQQGQIEYAVWRANRYATVNDNNDPNVINSDGFHFSELDSIIEKIVLPFREYVEANGESLYVNLNYVAFTGQIQGGMYHHANPAEYAEFMLAAFQHMQERYAFVPDAAEILLEPDNVSQWNGNLIGRAIVATADKLQAAGFTPEIIAPSCTSMANALTYFDALVQVSGAAERLSELSYHRYAGVSDATLRSIASRAQQRGLRTSMLEWWSDSNGHNTLHADLKTGNNGAWEHGVIGSPGPVDNSMTLYKIDDSNPADPKIGLNTKARLTRQYYRFVRPGAVRIGTQSTHSVFDPLAFIHPTGEWVVVVKASAGGTFNVRGLPPGVYGITYTTPAAYNTSLTNQTITAGKDLTTSIPRDGVLTVYSRSVRLINPSVSFGRFYVKIATLSPNVWLVIERSSTPADPSSWVQAGTLLMATWQMEWSEPTPSSGDPTFYRVRFQ